MTAHRPATTRAARCARPGCCGEFNDAGVLAAADVHVARRLAALAGETDPSVALAVALAVRGAAARARLRRPRDDPRHGDRRRRRAVDLVRAAVAGAGGVARARVAASPLRRRRPLRLDGGALYLDRYWREERQLAADLRALGAAGRGGRRARAAGGLDAPVRRGEATRASGSPPRPRCGAGFAVVAGGPGTGKTTTVARIVALLLEQAAARRSSRSPRRPARRPRGSRRRCTPRRPRSTSTTRVRERLLGLDASTLHRLLGWQPGTPQPLPPRPRATGCRTTS